jgi:hypothetical protein
LQAERSLAFQFEIVVERDEMVDQTAFEPVFGPAPRELRTGSS